MPGEMEMRHQRGRCYCSQSAHRCYLKGHLTVLLCLSGSTHSQIENNLQRKQVSLKSARKREAHGAE